MGDMVIIDGVERDRDEWLAEHAQRAHDEAVAAQEAAQAEDAESDDDVENASPAE